ncbi:MAG: hypothetical protein ACRDK7_06770 [Solirubrobacteraceae bacterium]
MAAAPGGDTVVLQALTELPGARVGATEQLISRRFSTGWATTPLDPSNDEPTDVESRALGAAGEAFSTVFLGDNVDLVPTDTDVNIDDVFAVPAEGALAWISQGPDGGVGTAPAAQPGTSTELADQFGGATPTLSHVIFQTPYGKLLTTDTHSYGAGIYDRLDQTSTELVGILPNNTVPTCGASLGGQQPSGGAGYDNSVSESGTTVFFESPDPVSKTTSIERPGQAACPAGDYTPPQLYVRLNDHETLDASVPAPSVTDPHGEQEARYATATPDGTDVLFTSKGALTSNANTDGDTTEDLYEYTVSTHTLTDISSEGLTDPNGSQVQGVLGVSDDGTIVCFVAKGKLTAQATDGSDNLYVSDAGQLSYITTLSSFDHADWEGVIQSRGSRLTPDGSHLLFSSTESLTGYSNAGHAELYLYTLNDPTPTCVSCGKPGTTAQGEVQLGGGGSLHSNWGPSTLMTANGGIVFFQSTESLTVGSTVGEPNVYEWDEGSDSLIAQGGEYGAKLVGATPSGSDVFFETYESLVPGDTDGGEKDIYDARVDGGLPAPPAPERQCESSSECAGPGTTLSAPTLLSLTQTGTGNLVAAANSNSQSTTSVTKKPTKKNSKSKAKSKLKKELKQALSKCKKLKSTTKRKSCETTVRKKYRSKSKATSKAKGKKKV